ncbi:uncharacterized protein N7525_001434 [Penicillium rubens]|uniref:uncharacterized protein n=1 Tax=Penicillium rubens TaxID=1108849 RepID=UPI002A59B838|nr:uncharacterized protein N7525_001434 [Penicillium rubens]KAJ5843693.1 hypothetical protein N7525_001434 [Penicillium rubens]KAJ5845720.1 hypothetical protein N7534_009389 [Penicillium rubens]
MRHLAKRTVIASSRSNDLGYKTYRLIIAISDETMGNTTSLLLEPTMKSTPIPLKNPAVTCELDILVCNTGAQAFRLRHNDDGHENITQNKTTLH